jgi:hypothetical protein
VVEQAAPSKDLDLSSGQERQSAAFSKIAAGLAILLGDVKAESQKQQNFICYFLRKIGRVHICKSVRPKIHVSG